MSDELNPNELPPADDTPPPAAAPALTGWTDDKGNFVKKDWTDDESLRSKFSSVEALAKSYKSLEQMVGKKGIIPPDDHATPEQISEFYGKLGRPAKPEEYDYKKPADWPEGLPYDENREKAFRAVAHEAGLSNKQFKAVVEWANKSELGLFQAANENLAKAQADAVAKLKADPEFGGDAYEKNVALASETAKKFGAGELMNDPVFGNNPLVLKLFANIGKAVGEDSVKGAEFGKASPNDVKGQIDKILDDKTSPYWNAKHPRHEEQVKLVSGLFSRLHPELPRA